MNDKLPIICSMTGIRKVVMQNVWKNVKDMEAQNRIVLNSDFSDLLKKEWSVQKSNAQDVCTGVSQPKVFDDDTLKVAKAIETRINQGYTVQEAVSDVLEDI